MATITVKKFVADYWDICSPQPYPWFIELQNVYRTYKNLKIQTIWLNVIFTLECNYFHSLAHPSILELNIFYFVSLYKKVTFGVQIETPK